MFVIVLLNDKMVLHPFGNGCMPICCNSKKMCENSFCILYWEWIDNPVFVFIFKLNYVGNCIGLVWTCVSKHQFYSNEF